jgi:VWFA-related protein
VIRTSSREYHECPRTLVLYCLIALGGGVLLSASAQAPAESTDKNAEMTSHDAPATFKAKVNLVLVPVVVRDSQGSTIGDLKKEDFLLFDKGKPQVITKFSMEKSGGQAAKVAEGSKPAEGAPEEHAPAVLPEHYTAYLFDDVHLAFGDLARVRDAADRHMASLDSTARAAIYTTSGQNTLDFTDDRAKLHETLFSLRPRPVSRAPRGMECPDVSYYQGDLIFNKNDQQAFQVATQDALVCMNLDPRMITVAQGAAHSAAQRAVTDGDHETRLALAVLKELVRRMSAIPGQRAIVLVSPGFLTPFDLISETSDVIERAIRANVIISALDARGLYASVPGGDASQRVSNTATVQYKAQYHIASAAEEADVLGELADATGGNFFHNSNDLDGGFKRVAAAPEYFYMLGFSPENLKLDGSYHKLKVTLKDGAKLSMQARRGYYAPRRLDDPSETGKEEIREALFSREELLDIPVELHTQFFKSSEESARVAVVIRVDVRHIHYKKVDGRNRNDLTVVSALFDRNGNYVTGNEKHLEMRLRDETVEKKLGSGLTVRTTFDVKPGTYLVRLVVRDAEGQMMAAKNGSVEIQ